MQTVLLLIAMLTGFVTQNQIMEYPEFANRYKQVKINDAKLTNISGKNVTVMVVLGTWCKDSVEHVPVFVKISEKIKFDAIDWLCVGRKLKDNTGVVSDLNIKRIPTFIFFRNGEEIGRIVETPEKTIEDDIKQILKR
jgi:thiol-disulfide isomerase/thioredoxin